MESDFLLAADRLIGRVAHWTPARWAKPSGAHVSRAELMHGLAQRLADAGADAEGRERRPVPRLDNDLALPDQVRVLVADIVAAAPPADDLAELTAAVRRVAAELT